MTGETPPLTSSQLQVAAARVVPPSGFTVRLTLFSAGAMAFLAVFAMALSVATDRLADRWSEALARTSTIRISAPAGQMERQTKAVLEILDTTPGIAEARVLSEAEQQALLEPWLGPNLPLASLPIPRLVEVVETAEGYNPDALRLRLTGEAPGAVLDDHTRWRRPLIKAAERLRSLGVLSLVLIGGSMAAMITLAAQAAMAANSNVIRVLRLVGARDIYIARAFVRRFTSRAFAGAVVGTILGMAAVALLPRADTAGGLLTGLGFQGVGWTLPLVIPPLAAAVSYLATRFAALRILRKLA